jgi:uracil-DNA glycosylase family 4
MFRDPCDTCPRRHRAIGGSGPQPARILAIAERPGEEENKNGTVLIGPTGQEFNELYLPLAGLHRSQVRACNVVMCWADSNKTPTDKEVAQCAPCHIPEEIERTRPEIIILMGASACKLTPGIVLDIHHGIPQPTSKVGAVLGWHGWVIPVYHPARGMRESRFMTEGMADWEGLKDIIGEDHFADDPKPEPVVYTYVRGYEVNDYFQAIHDLGHKLAMDTESHAGRPWSMQASGLPGTGILVRADDHIGLDCLDFWFGSSFFDSIVTMHHAAHDLEEARHMGVSVPRYRDTMQEAFHLGNLPQGLKALTYRLFRHTMTSYEETVRPASIRALTDWMTEAYQIAVLDLTYVSQRFSPKTGKRLKDETTRSDLESLLTRLLRLTDPNGEYDPWGSEKEPRLDAFWHEPVNEWMVQYVENRIGPYPLQGIANCSMEEAVRYAVGDADWTGRVAVELQRRRQGAFQIYSGDRDA